MSKDQFINETVLGWIKNDLTRMLDNKPLPSGEGNLNFPLALCSLCYMDYLGSFLLGKDMDSYTKHIKAYIRECFSNANEYPVEILGDIFRHGLAHDYFPRGAISRNGYHPAVYRGKTYDIVLDAESLTEDFLQSLNIFVQKLTIDKFDSRMKEALEVIRVKKEKHSMIIGNLPEEPQNDGIIAPSEAPPGSETTTSTTTSHNSGASGLSGPLNTTS